MRKLILSALAAVAVLASSNAFAGSYVVTDHGIYYEQTCAVVVTDDGWVRVCD